MTYISRARAEHKKEQQLAELPSLRHACDITQIA